MLFNYLSFYNPCLFYFLLEKDVEGLSVTDGPGEATKQSGEKTGLPTVPWIFLVLSNIITYTVKKRPSVVLSKII